jgi:sec-independent protein translocase protein TatA
MFRAFEPWHLIVLVAVIALLFGSKRLPDAARGLGQSMRIFKAEVKEMKDDSGRRKPGSEKPTSSTSSEALEGRVVDGERTAERAEHRHDA